MFSLLSPLEKPAEAECLTACASLSRVLVGHSSKARWATKTLFFSRVIPFFNTLELPYLIQFHWVALRTYLRLRAVISALRQRASITGETP
jgi:hypothetical protein